jgi:iron(III) transport system substrate-binding protein
MTFRLFASALAIIAATTAAQAQTKGQVNVVCVTSEWCDAMKAPFEAKTGYTMEYLNLRSNESLVRLRAEASNPTFDVFYGGTGDPHLVGFNEGVTEFFKPANYDELNPQFRAAIGETYLPLYANPIALVVNPSVLEAAGAPMPTSWADLTNPAYKGMMGMADPNSSGTAYTVIATLVQLFGEEEAFNLLAGMHQNMASYTKSGSGALGPVGQGELGIGVIFMASAVREKASGFPIEIIVPSEGTGYEIGGISLVKNAPNADGARAFIEYALSAEGQDLGSDVGQLQVKANVNARMAEGSPDLSAIKIIDYDFATYGDPDLQGRLIARWTNEIFPVPR